MSIEEPITIQIAENVTNVNVTDLHNRVEVNEDAPNEVTIYVPGTAGNQGPQGPRGFQGPQGSQGPQGFQGVQGRLFESETQPASPVSGDMWFKSSTGIVYAYYDSFWVELGSGSQGPQGPIGPQGVQGATIVGATAPITFNSGTQTVGIALGTGLTTTAGAVNVTKVVTVNTAATTALEAKPTGQPYPAAQIAASGKIWSQPSKFAPFTGKHNTTNVGYGSDTQVYLERSDLTSTILTVRMNRFQALDKAQAQVTSGSFPMTAGTAVLADASSFPNAAGAGVLYYDHFNDPLITAGPLSGSWTNQAPSAATFSVGATGAFCTALQPVGTLSSEILATPNSGSISVITTAPPTNVIVGTVIFIDSEQMTVTGVSGNTLTATRNVPSLAARHLVGAAIDVVTRPYIVTADAGELDHDVICRLSGTLATAMGIVVRYKDRGAGAASWISVRYNRSTGKVETYTQFRSTGGVITGDYLGSSSGSFASGDYIRAIVDGVRIAVSIGRLNDDDEIEYETPEIYTLNDSRLSESGSTNAGLYRNSPATTTALYSEFSVRASKKFTYTGKSGSSLTGVTCSTSKTFTATATTFMEYADGSPINLMVGVDSNGAVIWRLKNLGGQHTTDNITMGRNDDGGDVGLMFQSDSARTDSGLVFLGDSAPSGTSNASGLRGTFLRRVGARLLRMGGRLHIAPSDLTDYAGTATASGTPTAPHLSIGNVNTGLYLTTAAGVDTLNVTADGVKVASFGASGATVNEQAVVLTNDSRLVQNLTLIDSYAPAAESIVNSYSTSGYTNLVTTVIVGATVGDVYTIEAWGYERNPSSVVNMTMRVSLGSDGPAYLTSASTSLSATSPTDSYRRWKSKSTLIVNDDTTSKQMLGSEFLIGTQSASAAGWTIGSSLTGAGVTPITQDLSAPQNFTLDVTFNTLGSSTNHEFTVYGYTITRIR